MQEAGATGFLKSNYSILLVTTFLGNSAIPIFSLFLPYIAHQLGADTFEVGLVGGSSTAVYSFLPYVMGRYYDRANTKKLFIVLSLTILVVASFLYAFASSTTQLILLRVLEGVGWSILWPTIDVAVIEETSHEAGKSYSLYNIMWSAASAVGPLFGAALAFVFGDFRDIFLVTALVLLATAALASLGFHDRKPPGHDGRSPPLLGDQDHSLQAGVGMARGGRSTHRLELYMAAIILPSVIRGIMFTFFPVYANSVGIPIVVGTAVAFGFGAGRTAAFFLTTKDSIRNGLLRPDRIRRNILVSLAITSVAGALPLLPDRTGLVDLVAFTIVGGASSVSLTIGQIEMIARARAGEGGPERASSNLLSESA